MKVISGFLKGRKIEGHDISGTRPTMDRVKESLFAMIQDYIGDKVCIDLFAGSGNLGLEAISEGAKFCYFVDNNIKAINTIKNNINNFSINDYTSILKSDYKTFLENINNSVDIIFIDPPYKTNYIEKSIKLIDKYDILNPNGLLICESDDLGKIIYNNKFKSLKEKKYGDKWIVILKKVI